MYTFFLFFHKAKRERPPSRKGERRREAEAVLSLSPVCIRSMEGRRDQVKDNEEEDEDVAAHEGKTGCSSLEREKDESAALSFCDDDDETLSSSSSSSCSFSVLGSTTASRSFHSSLSAGMVRSSPFSSSSSSAMMSSLPETSFSNRSSSASSSSSSCEAQRSRSSSSSWIPTSTASVSCDSRGWSSSVDLSSHERCSTPVALSVNREKSLLLLETDGEESCMNRKNSETSSMTQREGNEAQEEEESSRGRRERLSSSFSFLRFPLTSPSSFASHLEPHGDEKAEKVREHSLYDDRSLGEEVNDRCKNIQGLHAVHRGSQPPSSSSFSSSFDEREVRELPCMRVDILRRYGRDEEASDERNQEQDRVSWNPSSSSSSPSLVSLSSGCSSSPAFLSLPSSPACCSRLTSLSSSSSSSSSSSCSSLSEGASGFASTSLDVSQTPPGREKECRRRRRRNERLRRGGGGVEEEARKEQNVDVDSRSQLPGLIVSSKDRKEEERKGEEDEKEKEGEEESRRESSSLLYSPLSSSSSYGEMYDRRGLRGLDSRSKEESLLFSTTDSPPRKKHLPEKYLEEERDQFERERRQEEERHDAFSSYGSLSSSSSRHLDPYDGGVDHPTTSVMSSSSSSSSYFSLPETLSRCCETQSLLSSPRQRHANDPEDDLKNRNESAEVFHALDLASSSSSCSLSFSSSSIDALPHTSSEATPERSRWRGQPVTMALPSRMDTEGERTTSSHSGSRLSSSSFLCSFGEFDCFPHPSSTIETSCREEDKSERDKSLSLGGSPWRHQIETMKTPAVRRNLRGAKEGKRDKGDSSNSSSGFLSSPSYSSMTTASTATSSPYSIHVNPPPEMSLLPGRREKEEEEENCSLSLSSSLSSASRASRQILRDKSNRSKNEETKSRRWRGGRLPPMHHWADRTKEKKNLKVSGRSERQQHEEDDDEVTAENGDDFIQGKRERSLKRRLREEGGERPYESSSSCMSSSSSVVHRDIHLPISSSIFLSSCGVHSSPKTPTTSLPRSISDSGHLKERKFKHASSSSLLSSPSRLIRTSSSASSPPSQMALPSVDFGGEREEVDVERRHGRRGSRTIEEEGRRSKGRDEEQESVEEMTIETDDVQDREVSMQGNVIERKRRDRRGDEGQVSSFHHHYHLLPPSSIHREEGDDRVLCQERSAESLVVEEDDCCLRRNSSLHNIFSNELSFILSPSTSSSIEQHSRGGQMIHQDYRSRDVIGTPRRDGLNFLSPSPSSSSSSSDLCFSSSCLSSPVFSAFGSLIPGDCADLQEEKTQSEGSRGDSSSSCSSSSGRSSYHVDARSQRRHLNAPSLDQEFKKFLVKKKRSFAKEISEECSMSSPSHTPPKRSLSPSLSNREEECRLSSSSSSPSFFSSSNRDDVHSHRDRRGIVQAREDLVRTEEQQTKKNDANRQASVSSSSSSSSSSLKSLRTEMPPPSRHDSFYDVFTGDSCSSCSSSDSIVSSSSTSASRLVVDGEGAGKRSRVNHHTYMTDVDRYGYHREPSRLSSSSSSSSVRGGRGLLISPPGVEMTSRNSSSSRKDDNEEEKEEEEEEAIHRQQGREEEEEGQGRREEEEASGHVLTGSSTSSSSSFASLPPITPSFLDNLLADDGEEEQRRDHQDDSVRSTEERRENTRSSSSCCCCCSSSFPSDSRACPMTPRSRSVMLEAWRDEDREDHHSSMMLKSCENSKRKKTASSRRGEGEREEEGDREQAEQGQQIATLSAASSSSSSSSSSSRLFSSLFSASSPASIWLKGVRIVPRGSSGSSTAVDLLTNTAGSVSCGDVHPSSASGPSSSSSSSSLSYQNVLNTDISFSFLSARPSRLLAWERSMQSYQAEGWRQISSEDLIVRLCSFLEAKDLVHLASTCRQSRHFVMQWRVWRNLCIGVWGWQGRRDQRRSLEGRRGRKEKEEEQGGAAGGEEEEDQLEDDDDDIIEQKKEREEEEEEVAMASDDLDRGVTKKSEGADEEDITMTEEEGGKKEDGGEKDLRDNQERLKIEKRFRAAVWKSLTLNEDEEDEEVEKTLLQGISQDTPHSLRCIARPPSGRSLRRQETDEMKRGRKVEKEEEGRQRKARDLLLLEKEKRNKEYRKTKKKTCLFWMNDEAYNHDYYRLYRDGNGWFPQTQSTYGGRGGTIDDKRKVDEEEEEVDERMEMEKNKKYEGVGRRDMCDSIQTDPRYDRPKFRTAKMQLNPSLCNSMDLRYVCRLRIYYTYVHMCLCR